MTRVAFLVSVNLDEMFGEFHTAESAGAALQAILSDRISHYEPIVSPTPVDTRKETELEELPNRHGRIDPIHFLFTDRAEAQLVLDGMRNIIRMDGTATVAEYLNLINAPSSVVNHYSNHYWGWKNTATFRLEILKDNTSQLHLGDTIHFTN